MIRKPFKSYIRLKKFPQEDSKERILAYRITAIILLLFFLLLSARLWYLQILHGDEYRAESERNRVKTVRLMASRGKILDRDGRLLAGVKPSFNICLIRKDITDMEALLSRLLPLLDQPSSKIRARLYASRKQPRFMPIVIERNASWETVCRVEARLSELPGVRVEVAPTRRYPRGKLAPHLLGYLGEISLKELQKGKYPHARSGDLVGKYGLEARYESLLAGHSGKKIMEVDARGRLIRVIKTIPPTPGEDLVLSLDLDLQLAAEEALGDNCGAVVVLNPRNGQILAMASGPKFDPSLFANGLSSQEWKTLNDPLTRPLINKAIQGQYPPGSTFKPFMATALLQEGIINPDETVFCNGSFKLGRRRFRCWKRWGHGKVNLYKSIVESCDVYYYQNGLKLGIDRIEKYSRLFGFGTKTGLDLPGEKPGFVPSRVWKLRRFQEPWQKGETLNVSIGQGFMLVTPLQLAMATAAIANDGKLYRPIYLLSQAPVLQKELGLKNRVIQIIKHDMEGVVEDKHGTARGIRLPDVTIAGKTGTAQVVKQAKAGQHDELPWKYRDHALFIAFAPVEDPQLAVAVIIEHGGHGGSAAAPVAKAVIERWYQKRAPKPSFLPEDSAGLHLDIDEHPALLRRSPSGVKS